MISRLFRRRGPAGTGISIGVMGNCHARGLADCIAQLCPGARLVRLTPQDPQAAEPGYGAAQIAQLADCDHVFYQPSLGARVLGIDTVAAAAQMPQATGFPTLYSASQLPDCHFLMRPKGGPLVGPAGLCHSAIIAGSWRAGLPAGRVPALFNRFVYAQMGYLAIDPAQEPAALEGARLGYDFDDFLSGRRGRFMHTHHHPTIGILFETARQALRKRAIRVEAGAVPPPDALALAAVWPAYPGLGGAPMAAEPHQAPGQMRFRLGIERDLGTFIAESYALYEREAGTFHSALMDRMAALVGEHVVMTRPA